MDNITELIRNEIKRQYKSVRQFSETSGIPYSTLSNALAKGVGGTAYETVVKICRILGIKQSLDSDLTLFSKEFDDFYSKLIMLDERGINTVCAVLNVEYDRCKEDENKTVKAYNGIGYAFESGQIRKLARKARRALAAQTTETNE